MVWGVFRCRMSWQGVYSTLYPIAQEGNQRSSYSTSYSLPQRVSSRVPTRPVIHCPRGKPEEGSSRAFYSTSLLDPGCNRGGNRLYSPFLLDPLLDQFTRSRTNYFTRLVDLSKRLWILLNPHSTRHLSIQIGEEEASTRPIDHSEHRHKGADFAAPSLLDPQDRALAQTASSLLSSS